VGCLLLFRSGPKSNAMGQVGGGAPLSYPQDHVPRSCSVLFACYFVIVISCVVYFISSLAPDRASLAERRLCVCHYRVTVSRSIAGRRPLWLRICFYNRYRAYFVKYFLGTLIIIDHVSISIARASAASWAASPPTCLMTTALPRPPVLKPSFVSFSVKCCEM
jgi:hypothetical protein